MSNSNFSIQQAKNLISGEIDHEVGKEPNGTSADQSAIFLGLLSSLVKQIEKLDSVLAKRERENTTILRESKADRGTTTAESQANSIIHPPGDQTSGRTEDCVESSVASRHAAAMT